MDIELLPLPARAPQSPSKNKAAPLKTPTNISKVMHMKLLDAAGREITPHFPREKTVLLYSCLKTAFHPTTPSPLLDTYLTERLEQILSQALREGNRFFISPASNGFERKALELVGQKKETYPDIEIYRIHSSDLAFSESKRHLLPGEHCCLCRITGTDIKNKYTHFLCHSAGTAVIFASPGIYRVSRLRKEAEFCGLRLINLYDEHAHMLKLGFLPPTCDEADVDEQSPLLDLPGKLIRIWEEEERQTIKEIRAAGGEKAEQALQQLLKIHRRILQAALEKKEQ